MFENSSCLELKRKQIACHFSRWAPYKLFIISYFSMLVFSGKSHSFLLPNEILQNLMSFVSKLVNFRYF